MENSTRLPTIRPDGWPRANCLFESCEDKVDRLVNGPFFQEFCNTPERMVSKDGGLLQICCCQENEYYVLSSEEDILSDFRINVLPRQGLRLYKRKCVVGRPSCGSEIRTFYTVTFWVTFKEGYWNTELILEDEGQLFPDKVKKAFHRIAELEKLTLQGEKPQMSSVRLSVEGTATFETKAWAQKFTTPEGAKRTLLCLMDNGRIIEVCSEELPVCEECNDAILRTKFGRYLMDGIYCRMD